MTQPIETQSIVERQSPYDFAETLKRVRAAIEGAGMTIFATIDHAASAEAVGLSMNPATVLIYGNPKGGTPVMRAAPLAALDLPLRVLVQEAPAGHVTVAYRPVEYLFAGADVDTDLAQRLKPAQALLLKALDHE